MAMGPRRQPAGVSCMHAAILRAYPSAESASFCTKAPNEADRGFQGPYDSYVLGTVSSSRLTESSPCICEASRNDFTNRHIEGLERVRGCAIVVARERWSRRGH